MSDNVKMGKEIENMHDIMVNLFTEKYDFKQKLTVLAELEKDKPLFVKIIKQYHPQYYIDNLCCKDSVATVHLIDDVRNNKSTFISPLMNKS